MTMSYFFAGKVIDHLLRNQAYSPPATLYLALYSAAPGKSGGGTEFTGTGYGRQSVALAAFSVNADGTTQNTADVEWLDAGGTWGTASHVGVHDASTAGNLLLYQALNSSRGPILIHDDARFLAGELVFTFD